MRSGHDATMLIHPQHSSIVQGSILVIFGRSIQKILEFARVCFHVGLLVYQLFVFHNRTPKISRILALYQTT